MADSTSNPITITVTLRVEVDPKIWAENRGLLDPTRTRGYNTKEIVKDVRSTIAQMVINSPVVEETDAIINGIRPDTSYPTLPPTLIQQDDGSYLRIAGGQQTTVEIDHEETRQHSFNCNDGDILITDDGDVFRLNNQGHYTQRQSPCDSDRGNCDCEQTGREIVDRYAHDVFGEHNTMITCLDCTRLVEENI